MFAHYELFGELQDINIRLVGGQGGQIDLFGELQSNNGTKRNKCVLIGEMKDRKTKVSKPDIENFLRKISLVKTKYKLENVICIYICTGGFFKPAQQLLKKNNIFYGTCYDLLKQM